MLLFELGEYYICTPQVVRVVKADASACFLKPIYKDWGFEQKFVRYIYSSHSFLSHVDLWLCTGFPPMFSSHIFSKSTKFATASYKQFFRKCPDSIEFQAHTLRLDSHLSLYIILRTATSKVRCRKPSLPHPNNPLEKKLNRCLRCHESQEHQNPHYVLELDFQKMYNPLFLRNKGLYQYTLCKHMIPPSTYMTQGRIRKSIFFYSSSAGSYL